MCIFFLWEWDTIYNAPEVVCFSHIASVYLLIMSFIFILCFCSHYLLCACVFLTEMCFLKELVFENYLLALNHMKTIYASILFENYHC